MPSRRQRSAWIVAASAWATLWAIECLRLAVIGVTARSPALVARWGLTTGYWVPAGAFLTLAIAHLVGRGVGLVRLVPAAALLLVVVTAGEAAWSQVVLGQASRPFVEWWGARSDVALYIGAVFPLLVAIFHRRSVSAQLAGLSAARRASRAAARLHQLNQELQPHFLFNALGATAELVQRGGTEARRVIGHLITMFDRLENRDESGIVSVRQAVADLRPYLEIQQVRFGPRLRLDVQVSPAAAGAWLPSHLLQPLMENAIRHGVEPALDGGSVALAIELAANSVRVTVRNTVADAGPRVDRRGSGIGLSNARERLDCCYGRLATLEVVATEREFVVTIVVPAAPSPPTSGPDGAGPADRTAAFDRWRSPRQLAAVGAMVAASLIGYWTAWGLVLAPNPAGWVSALGGWPIVGRELGYHLLTFVALVGLVVWSPLRRWPVRRVVLLLSLVLAGGLVALAFRIGAMPVPRVEQLQLLGAVQGRATFVATVLTGAVGWRWHLESLEREVVAWRARGDRDLAELASTADTLNPAMIREALVRLQALAVDSPEQADRMTVQLARFLRARMAGSGATVLTKLASAASDGPGGGSVVGGRGSWG